MPLDIHEKLKKAFDEKDISIPYPHREVYIHNADKESKETA